MTFYRPLRTPLVLDRQSSGDHQPPDLGHGETASLGTPGEPASSSLDRPYQPINAGTPVGSLLALVSRPQTQRLSETTQVGDLRAAPSSDGSAPPALGTITYS